MSGTIETGLEKAAAVVWRLLDSGRVVHRSNLVIAWVLTFQVVEWSYRAAEASTFNAAAIAALAGFMTPVLGLTGYVIKKYTDYRKPQGGE